VTENRLHRHDYNVSIMGGLLHAYCRRCGKVSFRPWWPLWKYHDHAAGGAQ
jgi:hypothetical protein